MGWRDNSLWSFILTFYTHFPSKLHTTSIAAALHVYYYVLKWRESAWERIQKRERERESVWAQLHGWEVFGENFYRKKISKFL